MISPRTALRRSKGKGEASHAGAGSATRAGTAPGLSNQLLQRHAGGGAGAPPFRNRGRPLDRAARDRFAPHFSGLDEVRIHDDAEGSRAATALGARAFTAGRDIAFGPGFYAPGTAVGAHLLAHELAHVAQGGGTIRRAPLEGEEEVPLPPVTSLFTLDYWGDKMCGGHACFTDEMIEQFINESERANHQFIVASLPPPIGEIGNFQVSIGSFSEKDPDVPLAAPAAAGTARVPGSPAPGLGENRIVMGDGGYQTVSGALTLAEETGQPIVRLRPGALAGAQEISLIAHADTQLIDIGRASLTPEALADKLVESGFRGRIIRLIACSTGLACADLPIFGQRLTNALARHGVETAIIAPEGKPGFDEATGRTPRVLPPGADKMTKNVRDAGKGWRYFVAEVPTGPAPPDVEGVLPRFHPGTWSGAGMAGAQMALMLAASYFHAQAVARRAGEQRAETGFAPWGPTGDTLYDIGAWLLDPGDEAGRSIPLDERFDMPIWRRHVARTLYAHPVGEEFRMAWWTSEAPRPFESPRYRVFYGIYRKLPDGGWMTLGCEDCEGKDFPPDLEKIISPFVSDDELYDYLDLPRGDPMSA